MSDNYPSHVNSKSSAGRHATPKHSPSHAAAPSRVSGSSSAAASSRASRSSREQATYEKHTSARSSASPCDTISSHEQVNSRTYSASSYNSRGKSRIKRKARIYDLILCISFFIVVFIVGVISVTDEDPTVSELENRTLKAYPEFSFKSLADGSFFLDFEEAYNDTFPSRDFWVTRSAAIKSAITLKYEDTIVYEVTAGEFSEMDGTLAEIEIPVYEETPPVTSEISIDNDNSPAGSDVEEQPVVEEELEPVVLPEYSFDISGFEQFVNIKPFVNGQIVGDRGMYVFNGSATNAEYFCQVCYALKSLYPRANLVSVLVPEGSAYYGREQDKTGYHDQQAYVELLRKNSAGYMIIPDIHNALEQHKDEYIYFKTDHHWTQLGAYYAYVSTMEALGYDAVDINSLESGTIDYFLGSFYKNFNSDILKNNPDHVDYYYPSVSTTVICHNDRSDLSVEKNIDIISEPDVDPKTGNKYLCFIGGDNPLTEINTNAGTGKTALVIKSSHANCFIPWLCHNYDKIYAIDPRHVNTKDKNSLILSEYFAGVKIDDIIICGGCNSANKVDFLNSMVYLISGKQD